MDKPWFKRNESRIIYTDPLTEKNQEGRALLQHHIRTDHYGLSQSQAIERWVVLFDGGADTVERDIKRHPRLPLA